MAIRNLSILIDVVGIGTTNPASALHVDNGVITTGRYGNSGALVLRSASGTTTAPTALANASNAGIVVFRGYDGSSYLDMASIYSSVSDSGSITPSSSGANLIFNTTTSGTTTVSEKMRITNSGNVGIGTASPGYPLDVNGVVNATGGLRYGSNAYLSTWGGDSNLPSLSFDVGDGIRYNRSSDSMSVLIGNASALGLTANTLSGTNATFSGSVGIGTTVPGERLSVLGTAAGNDATNGNFAVYDSAGVLRSKIYGQGGQVWNLNDTTAEVGQIVYGTPNATPGIIFRNTAGNGRSQIRQTSSTGGLSFAASTGSTPPFDQMVLTTGGNVGIGTTAPLGALDVSNGVGSTPVVMGADSGASTRTDATQKEFRLGMPHYTNAQGIFGILYGQSTSTANNVFIGGGTGWMKAATNLAFYTASNQTTTSGTERMRIDSSGNVGIGTSPSTTLDIVSAQASASAAPYKNGLLIRGDSGTLGGGVGVLQIAGSPNIIGYRAQGTLTAPTAVASGNSLLNLTAYGHDGTGYTTSGVPAITISSTEAWSSTAHGSNLQFKTVANGTTTSGVRMTIDQTGNVGIGTTTPSTRLTVSSANHNGLDIAADTSNTGYSGRLYLSNNTAGQSLALLNNSGKLEFRTNATPGTNSGILRMTMDTAGNVGIGDSTTKALRI